MMVSEQSRLAGWAQHQAGDRCRQRGSRRGGGSAPPLRFAFYGRISTADYQDPRSSCAWQRCAAEDVIAGRGTIVAEFFDVGCTRLRGWADRPEAAALLEAVADPTCGFDAIVVGEYERAFCGTQLLRVMPLLERHGVQVWLPELDGPFHLADVEHRATIRALGAYARREVVRARFRTTAAMRAQARLQGRHLGGRPPYGYRLVDAGPHPNTAQARWGRRLHRLDLDPATAPVVRRIFTRRLAGYSVARIARELNEDGVPCPSRMDRARNPHRSGEAWTLRTVAAILANPRYTGRQVWNRQRTERQSHAGGVSAKRNWNPTGQWAISDQPAHPAIVSEDEFTAVQRVSAVPVAEDGGPRTYLFVGLMVCGLCGRRLDSHWVNNRPGYRCRHGHTSAKPVDPSRPPNLYLREDHVSRRVRTLITDLGIIDPTDTTFDRDPHAVAEVIRAHQLTVVCDADTVHLDVETATSIRPRAIRT
jgi:site-specific DNA recombinase